MCARIGEGVTLGVFGFVEETVGEGVPGVPFGEGVEGWSVVVAELIVWSAAFISATIRISENFPLTNKLPRSLLRVEFGSMIS